MGYRNENVNYPGTAWRPSLSFTPQSDYERIKTNPNATELYWWRAIPDLSIDPHRARNTAFVSDDEAPAFGASSGGSFVREMQSSPTGSYWAIIDGERILRRYFQPGTWETGDIAVLFNPSDIALSEWDWIVQKGQGGAPNGAIDARTFTQKETIRRGSGTGGKPLQGTGTATIALTAVTGSGTAFTSFFRAGDVFTGPNGFMARVVSITSDTALTLDASPGATTLTAVPYGKGIDYLLFAPAASVSLLRDAGQTYVQGTHFNISADGEYIQWLSAAVSPLPGSPFAIVYETYNRYVITGLGQKGAVVKGLPMLSLVTARLWKPEHNRR